MGLLEQEIKELRQLNRDFAAGKIEAEKVMVHIAIFSQTEKRSKMMLRSHEVELKYNSKRHLRRMITANLIGDSEAIDTVDGDPEVEKVKCPGKGFELIERNECLDFSGSMAFPECDGCKIGVITKRRLLG